MSRYRTRSVRRKLLAYADRFVPPWLYQEWRWFITGWEQQARYARDMRRDRKQR